MRLKKLKLHSFRNFTDFEADLDAASVVFTGKNGSGKSSLLESIYYLSKLRSFRTSRPAELKKIASSGFSLELCADFGKGYDQTIFVSEMPERKLFSDNCPVSKASDFALRFDVVTFLPDDPLIITGSPSIRRRLIDMLISSMDHDYFLSLQKYKHSLNGYNGLLSFRKEFSEDLKAFSILLAESGSFIIQQRKKYLHKLKEECVVFLQKIREEWTPFEIVYKCDEKMTSAEYFQHKLFESFKKDQLNRKTETGPHYDDFEFFLGGKSLRHFGSRGQCRIASLIVRLSELKLIQQEKKIDPVILVDDALADLDGFLRKFFIDSIKDHGQIFFAFPSIPPEDYFRNSREIQLK